MGLLLALQALVRQRQGHLGLGEFLGGAAFNPLLLPSPFGLVLFPLNGPAWSLFFEMMANVAMALVLIRLRTRVLFVVVGVAMIALIAVAVFAPGVQRWPMSANSALDGGAWWDSFQMGFARTFFSFTMGMALARLPQSPRRIQRVWALPLCALFVVLLALRIAPPARLPYDLFVVCVASPMIIYGCSRFEPDRRFAPVARFVGEVSFALYAIHYQILGAFYFIEKRTHLSVQFLTPFYMATSLLLAWVAVRWFDIPARRYLGRLILR